MRSDAQFPKRIRNSIILSFMGSVVIMLSIFGWWIYFFTKQHLENEMGKRLVAIGSMTVADITPWLLPQLTPGAEGSRTFQLLQSKLLKATQTSQVSRVYIADLNNRALVDTDATVHIGIPYFEHQLYAQELAQARSGHAAATKLFLGKDQHYYKLAFLPITLADEVIAVLGVQAGAEFFTSLEKLRRYLVVAVLIISLLIIGVGVLISERLIQPIGKLVHAAGLIGTGDLTSTVVLPHKNEFGRLAAAIDTMRLKLLEKDNRMRIMLQGIAHEIRNPLGGIELFAGLLKEDIDKKKTEQLASVKKIQEEVQNLKMTVEQFLDFARDPALQIEPVDAQDFFQDLLNTMKLAALEQEVVLAGHVQPSVSTLWCDRRLLKAAVINIMQNSLQALHGKQPATGRIELLIKDAETPLQEKAAIAISVADNGIGIPPADLANIFQPFFTTKERGCGLGLAFCEKIVHSHGGVIELYSTAGHGTQITILLPAIR